MNQQEMAKGDNVHTRHMEPAATPVRTGHYHHNTSTSCEAEWYDDEYLLIASRGGKVQFTRVMDQKRSLNEASKRPYIHVLEWWKQEGWTQVENLRVGRVLANLSRASLEWWYAVLGQSAFQGCNKLTYSKVSTEFDQLDSLKWWASHDFGVDALKALVEDCTRDAKLQLLDWLPTWTVVTLDVHSTVLFAFIATLELLGIPFTIASIDLDSLCTNGDMHGLEFALESGAKLVYTDTKALTVATEKHMLNVLDRWLKCSLPIKLPDLEADQWVLLMHLGQWWIDHRAELELRV
ncbi:hypothetical protein BCR44DRAFT_1514660 [Catenaria anguillulae PL171]|uniref:Uncharacterized protein n=1 Tax=Catenaria anguillulae PL171 TaxID=765915 RepID=A0A1Y2HIG2_9FUNG|nr:hypothetical protein BCR44DRAFT_1514660 [Catenaria anguillulae PL171]